MKIRNYRKDLSANEITPVISFDPLKYIKSCGYIAPEFRNKELEKNLMLAAKVELELLLTLSDESKINQWFPSFKMDGFRISSTWYKIDVEHLFYNNNSVFEKICFDPYGNKIKISDLPEFSLAYFMFIRLFAIQNNMKTKGSYDDIMATYQLARELKINTEDIFKEVSARGNSLWTRSYLNNYSIRADWYYKNVKYNFHGDRNSLIYSIEKRAFGTDQALLPITYWQKQGEVWPVAMHVMPEGKHPLYNLNLIRQHRRTPIFLTEHINVAHGNLSDEDHIWTSWYGGIDAIDHVDWGDLFGRTVYYVLIYNKEDAKENIKTALKLYEKFVELENMHLKIITYGICLDNNASTLDDDSLKFVIDDSLFALADKYGVSVPPTLLEYKDRFIFVDDLNSKSTPQYIVNPSIKVQNLAVLYAPSGVGKSWLSMSVGLAVARGVKVFPGWEVPSPKKVLYIAGEMTKTEISDRFFTLKQIYGPAHTWRRNFIARRVYMDLSNLDDQKKVEKDIRDLNSPDHNVSGQNISLLILDNLTTLVRNGDFKSSWDQFFEWLENLKKSFGLTILLVHHENKLGKYLGTSGIKNKTDFLIHASDIDIIAEKLMKLKKKKAVKASGGKDENGDGDDEDESDDEPNEAQIEFVKSLYNPEIVMYIHQQKLRGSSKKDFPPIRIALNPDDEKPEWKVTTPTYYEWRNRHTPDSFYQYATAADEDDTENTADAGGDISQEPLPQGSANDTHKIQPGIQPKSNVANKPLEPTGKKTLPRVSVVPWKILTTEEKKKAIIDCRERGMTSTAMAKYFEVSKRNIDAVRRATETRDCDLKPKVNDGLADKKDVKP